MDERTEAPTARRLQELSDRGDTARSQDLIGAVALLAAVVGLQQVAPAFISRATGALRAGLLRSSQATLTAGDLPGLFAPVASAALVMLAGVTLPAATVALAAGLFQIRGRLAYGALRPDPSRLNPFAGFRRIFGADSLAGLLWPLLKLVVVCLAIQAPVRRVLDELPTAIAGGLGAQLRVLGGTSLEVARDGAGALVVLAVVDVAYRRWQFLKRARMTRHEVREELRQSEGDPNVRGRIRAQQRRLARNRMMHRVPEATVVIVNPTHVAVALAYDVSKPAPEVVAKGADLLAARIVSIAREHRVPVVPNPPLARALYRSVEVGQPIPSTLYQAVAEILAYVFTVRRRN